MVAKLNLPINVLMPPGNVYKIILAFSSDSWSRYFLSGNETNGKKLKPVITNLHLKLRTYRLLSLEARLEAESHLRTRGYRIPYNTITTEKFPMNKGRKTYETVMVNGGKPFLYAFVAITTYEAEVGTINRNPYEFLIKKINQNGKNSLLRITATQGQKELNKTWRREGGGDEAENILTDYLRNHELAGTWNTQQKTLY